MSKLKMIFWPVFTLIMFCVALFFNYTASTGLVSDLDVGEVSDEYNLEITPAGWTFTIWGFIYIWQFLWIGYVLFLTCKYDMDTVIFGKWFFFLYNLASVFNALWIIIWVNEHVVWAMISLLGITVCLLTAAYIAHKYMYDVNRPINAENYGAAAGTSTEIEDTTPQWLRKSSSIRPLLFAFVVNGIPFYATWCVVASHLNVGIVICYKLGMTNTNASILMLSVLTCVILGYWFLDFYRLRFYLQYTYSPYIVLIVAFTGILTNGGLDVEKRPSSAFVLALLIIAVLGTIAKVIMGICMRNQPAKVLQSV